ncbi:MAG: urease accessory protein UreD [Burkholderiales bacterium]
MFAQETTFAGWQARLDLEYAQRRDTTVLTRRVHIGPLRVQKPFYPEGGKVCHSVLLHPPAGIVGGDELAITVSVGDNAHALLTTPGAAKWYRSAAPWATQQLEFAIGNDAALEWLPQETIVFDGARAGMQTTVALAATASFIGWEVLCLGRRASGERFDAGALTMATRLERAGRPLWLERGGLEGGSEQLYSSAGLAGFSVSATLLATGNNLSPALLAACRQAVPAERGVLHGVTLLPEVLVARYLGHSAEAARLWFSALWGLLRPAMLGREAHRPRIWNT